MLQGNIFNEGVCILSVAFLSAWWNKGRMLREQWIYISHTQKFRTHGEGFIQYFMSGVMERECVARLHLGRSG